MSSLPYCKKLPLVVGLSRLGVKLQAPLCLKKHALEHATQDVSQPVFTTDRFNAASLHMPLEYIEPEELSSLLSLTPLKFRIEDTLRHSLL